MPPEDLAELARSEESPADSLAASRQRETLLDFAWTEGVAGLRPEFVEAVLARDWPRLVNGHLYVRCAAHAPDHARNLAFAARWTQ